MFRTARVTFHTTRFGGETVTDIFRVLVTDQQQQDSEVRSAVHDTGERDFRILSWSWAD